MKTTHTLAETTTPEGDRMVLLEHDGQYFLKVNGVPLMSTTATSSEQMMADLAWQAAGGQVSGSVLIGGLGFGFTLRRVLELAGPRTSVVVAELLPQILEWNQTHLCTVNGHLLDDPRVEVRLGDVADILRQSRPASFDLVLLDVDNGPDGLVARKNDQLYDPRGFQIIRTALAPHGVAVFWSARPDPQFVHSLSRAGFSVEAVPAKAYPKAKRFSHTLFVAKPGRAGDRAGR